MCARACLCVGGHVSLWVLLRVDTAAAAAATEGPRAARSGRYKQTASTCIASWVRTLTVAARSGRPERGEQGRRGVIDAGAGPARGDILVQLATYGDAGLLRSNAYLTERQASGQALIPRRVGLYPEARMRESERKASGQASIPSSRRAWSQSPTGCGSG